MSFVPLVFFVSKRILVLPIDHLNHQGHKAFKMALIIFVPFVFFVSKRFSVLPIDYLNHQEQKIFSPLRIYLMV